MTDLNLTPITKDIKKQLLKWDISKAKERAKTGETASRADLVDDFLSILGYKRENDDLRYEYTVKVQDKNRKADIVIVDGKARSPLVIIECKRSNEALTDKHLNQLIQYLAFVPESKLGILTNGLDYQFYLKGAQSSTPFLAFNVETLDDGTINTLASFHRNIFKFNDFKAIAEDFYFVESFEKALLSELEEQSPDLLKLIYRRMGGKRFDEKIESKLKSLLNSFSLQDAVDKLRDSESRNSKLGIVTTQEELTAFSVVRTIIATSGKVKPGMLSRIGYRDFKGHFSIIVDDSQTKSICTLDLAGKKALRIDNNSKDLEDPIEVSLSKYKKEIIDSALRYLA